LHVLVARLEVQVSEGGRWVRRVRRLGLVEKPLQLAGVFRRVRLHQRGDLRLELFDRAAGRRLIRLHWGSERRSEAWPKRRQLGTDPGEAAAAAHAAEVGARGHLAEQ
jgi:hypothetical protein